MTTITEKIKQVVSGKPAEVEVPTTKYITTCGFPFAVLEFGGYSHTGEVIVFGTLEGYEKLVVLHWDEHFNRQAFNLFTKVYNADDNNAYADFKYISDTYKEAGKNGMTVEIRNSKENK